MSFFAASVPLTPGFCVYCFFSVYFLSPDDFFNNVFLIFFFMVALRITKCILTYHNLHQANFKNCIHLKIFPLLSVKHSL